VRNVDDWLGMLFILVSMNVNVCVFVFGSRLQVAKNRHYVPNMCLIKPATSRGVMPVDVLHRLVLAIDTSQT